MKTVQIYSLNCPFTKEVKYVGKTQNTLSNRLSAHLTTDGKNIEKDRWIKALREKSTKPTINLLEIVNDGTWAEREIYWIDYFLDNGIELLNDKLNENHKTIIFGSYRKELHRLMYRKNTIDNYCSIFIKYLIDFDGRIYREIGKSDIVNYLTHLVETKNISWSYQNQIINAIKFYYEKVLGCKRETYYINRPKKTSKIRPILTPNQVKTFIGSVSYLKQKALFQTMYSGALRTGEITMLLVSSINFEERKLKIIDAKGGNDRIISLPEHTLNLLKIYIEKFSPKYWLFEGQEKGSHYSSGSVQEKFSEAIKILGYDPELTPHCLRHSRLSHVLNNGVKIEMASKYAGHKSIATTADIYHHYMHEEMQEQFDDADEKMLGRISSHNVSDVNKSISISAEDTKKKITVAPDKLYHILLNEKTYLLKEKDCKILEATEGAKWSIGVSSEKAIAWFEKKGAVVSVK